MDGFGASPSSEVGGRAIFKDAQVLPDSAQDVSLPRTTSPMRTRATERRSASRLAVAATKPARTGVSRGVLDRAREGHPQVWRPQVVPHAQIRQA